MRGNGCWALPRRHRIGARLQPTVPSTRQREFADVSIFWFDRALEMRRSGQGVAGFAAYVPNADPVVQWHSDREFLMGATGVALSLLAASSSVEPLWDRLLLASVRPKPM